MINQEQGKPFINCLIVEDDEDYAILIRSYLQEMPLYDCRVDWESDFDTALAKLRSQANSVCFVDYFMGERNGIDFVKSASQAGATVPLILLTGSTDPNLYVEASNAGATDFLVKEEISAASLARTIRFALATEQKNKLLRKRQAKLEEATRELAEQRTLLQLAFDHTRHGIALFDFQSRLEACNAKYLEIYGFSPKKVCPGMKIDEILQYSISLGNFSIAEAKRILSERLTQVTSSISSTYHQRLSDGRTIAVVHEPIEGGRSVTTCEDITESLTTQRRSAELARSAALADAEGVAKAKFLSNMSHELRTPLNAIIGFAEAMSMDAFGQQGEGQYKEYANHILESAKAISRVVKQVLDMSLINASELAMNEEDFSLYEVIVETVDKYRGEADHKNVKIHARNRIQPITFRGDRAKIAQAIENVLHNGVKFCLPHGMVVVSLDFCAEGGAIITISDTGAGIPRQQLKSILSPFEQQEAAETRRNHGTGLGLPIALGLIRLHGGDIHIDSATGLGTTVKIKLPPERVNRPTATPLSSRCSPDRETPELSETRMTIAGIDGQRAG